MAKSTKEKAEKKPRKSRGKKSDPDLEHAEVSISEAEEPLSNFQDIDVTGRVDAAASPVKKKTLIVQEVRLVEKSFLQVSYSRIEPDGSNSNHAGVLFHGRYVHADTLQLFQDLRIHFALACEQVSVKQLKNIQDYNPELVEKYSVLKVKIKDEDGVSITGYKLLSKGPWNFTAPFIRFSDDEQSSYRYIDELREKLESLQSEVAKYIDGTKVGQDPQGKLEFGSPSDDTYSEEDI